ncbi:MAG: PQQ-dependent sugar dehydrogenase [Anaerolinea sp.]|nr:PQQ-dependent sugar dehydrogenase [Anaerolinea sp.]
MQKVMVKYIFLVICLVLVTVFVGGQVQEVAQAETAVSILATAEDTFVYLPVVLRPSPPPTVQIVPFATGFNTDTITDIAHAHDGRLFVTQREGRIRVVNPDGSVLPDPFLDIHGNVSLDNWEQGLLGLVFHPNYPQTPYFYVSYTSRNAYRIAVERYTVSPTNPNEADPYSGVLLMTIEKALLPNGLWSQVHNAGDMTFGADGYLYIAIGDGGPDPASENIPGDPNNNGQRLNTLLGKILRIDVDGGGLPPQCNGMGNTQTHYTIPPTNPYAYNAQACGEIWASGLRNSWRFSIDAVTGDMFIGDVGEERFEEINYQAGGAAGGVNYGWHCYEGTFDYTQLKPEYALHCFGPEQYVFPVFEYDNSTTCSSVVGGFVYRGQAYPDLYGRYLFADFCAGEFKTLSTDYAGGWVEATASDPAVPTSFLFGISTFGEDVNGELYAGKWVPPGSGSNTIYRVIVSEPTR